jgi:hypothetical protein
LKGGMIGPYLLTGGPRQDRAVAPEDRIETAPSSPLWRDHRRRRVVAWLVQAGGAEPLPPLV